MVKVGNKVLCENCFAEIEREPCSECGFSQADYVQDTMVLPIGSILENRYIIGRCIGKGGFGITYLAYDKKLECKVAIKEYYPSNLVVRDAKSATVTVFDEQSAGTFKGGADKFYDEARLIAQFNENPNVVSVHDFFYANDTAYFTMGFLRGMTLKEYIGENGPLSIGQAVCLANDVSNALAIAHSLNVLHRDISPSNIMICSDGIIKLLDFGAARQIAAEGSQNLSVILTRGFAPLEQYQKRGKQGPWTDIYALGGTLYNAVTSDILEDPMSRLEDDSEYLSNKYNIEESFWKIIKKATALKREDRYQDIFEFQKDINSLNVIPERMYASCNNTETKSDVGKTMPFLSTDRLGITMPAEDRTVMQEEDGEREKADMWGKESMPEKKGMPGKENMQKDIDAQKRTEGQKNMGTPIRKSGKKIALAAAALALLAVIAAGVFGRRTDEVSSDHINDTKEEQQTAQGDTDAKEPEEKGGDAEETQASEEGEKVSGEVQENEQPQEEEIPKKRVSGTLKSGTVEGKDVFGNDELDRTLIERISFLDTQDGIGENAWDVSQEQDGSVMAWTDESGKDLYLAGNGNIAVESAYHMFGNYENVKEIQFNQAFDTSHLTDMHGMFASCKSLEALDLSSFDTSHVTNMVSVFYECSSLTELDLSSFDTSKVTDMSWLFAKCRNLQEINLDSMDTSHVKNMGHMFQECSSLKILDLSNFDTVRVMEMSYMFWECNNLEEVNLSSFDTGRVKNMEYMFAECVGLETLDVSGFNTKQATNMQWMFSGCSSLEALDLSSFYTSQTEDMNCMFYGCISLETLDLSSFDTIRVKNMHSMFQECESLETLDIDNFDTSQVTDMGLMFCKCSSLKKIDLGNFDTSQVTDMSYMFWECTSLDGLDLSDFDTSQVADDTGMFDGAGITAEEAKYSR